MNTRMDDAGLAKARAQASKDNRVQFRARSVSYLQEQDYILITLNGHGGIAFSRSDVAELVQTTPEQLAAIEIWPDGSAIEIPDADIHIDVHTLVQMLLPEIVPARELASALARSRAHAGTEAQRLASRVNGQRGGRPRKKAEAA